MPLSGGSNLESALLSPKVVYEEADHKLRSKSKKKHQDHHQKAVEVSIER